MIYYFSKIKEQHESSKSKFLTDSESIRLLGIASTSTLSPTSNNNNSVTLDPSDDTIPENGVELSMKRRSYVLEELIKTEETYVQDLALIVDGYIKEIRNPDSDIPMPEDLKGGKERMIFGNLEAIYEWHRE